MSSNRKRLDENDEAIWDNWTNNVNLITQIGLEIFPYLWGDRGGGGQIILRHNVCTVWHCLIR